MSAVLPGPTPPGRLVSRFAPSPTGELHLGNARTALFSLLLARRAGGRFLLRIEDTDSERSQDVHDAALLADLHWLGIDWDAGPDRDDGHGPYRQSQRAALYAQDFAQLAARDAVYVDLERHRHVRLTTRRRREPGQLDFAEIRIAP